MASEALPLAQAKTAARQMLVSGLHDYRVTDFGAPDLNNLTVQCNGLGEIDLDEIAPKLHRRPVINLVGIDPKLLRKIIKIKCGE
jgi:hypothetical protein